MKNKVISYKDIKAYRDIKKITGDEEIVRAYLITKLVNELGYKAENIEIEKVYDIGRPKVNKPRIDVIVRNSKGEAFLYIEVKSPEDYEKDQEEIIEKQLFNLASQEKGQGANVTYLVLYSLESLSDDKPKDKLILIDYDKYSSFEEWKDERNFIDTIPKRYGKAQKKPYTKGGAKDLETNFSKEKLDNLRKDLHNVFVGWRQY